MQAKAVARSYRTPKGELNMQQLSLFDEQPKEKPEVELSDLFEAYFACRSNKRNTINALAFEVNYESNLVKLCEEINNGTYLPGKSIAFIVDKPVQREIFRGSYQTPPHIHSQSHQG